MFTEDEIDEIVARLEADMERHPSFANRKWSDDYVRVWLAGEIALADFTGVKPDFTSKLKGDGGTDSVITFKDGSTWTVNVKTSKKPYNLLAEPNRSRADIYMLAQYFPETRRASLLGWHWGSVIYNKPTRTLNLNGKPLHCLPIEELRDLRILKEKMK
jgi:hypothetical protein